MRLTKFYSVKSGNKEIRFPFFLKISKLGVVLILCGSFFQSRGAQTEKALSP